MDLTKAVLPDSIMVSGSVYRIKTGHSFWFRFAEIMSQEKKYLGDFEYLYVEERPEDRQAGINAMYDFFYEPKELPRSDGSKSDRVLDYAIDADLIYTGILECFGVDLYEKQLHWHKVRAMIAGLHDTKLNEIISFRCSTDTKNKEMMKAREAWRLPDKLNPEDKEELDRISDVFSGAQF